MAHVKHSDLLAARERGAVMLGAGDTIACMPGFIVVRRLSRERSTAGGLILTESSESPYEGVVLSVGEGVDQKLLGERVVFLHHAAIHLQRGDERLLVLKAEGALFGVIQGGVIDEVAAEDQPAEAAPARRRGARRRL